jgi:glycosyltransferase 2 family protein
LDKRRIAVTSIIVFILGVLVYFQFRQWRHFDWATFWMETHQSSLKHVFHGVAYIYLADTLRAWRWQIFLRPRKGSWLKLISPTFIGFTGLALLGRLGEFVRPYLIARREDLPFSSQIAVWIVERIFDIGAFIVLMLIAVAVNPSFRRSVFLLGSEALRTMSLHLPAKLAILVVVGAVAAALAVLISRNLKAKFGRKLTARVAEFRAGLDTIHGPFAFVQLSACSIAIWLLIALSYLEVTHSYSAPILQNMTTADVLLLMGSSMAGSVLQLPAVGGGSQLATIAVLFHHFDVPRELAVSCGILLWLTTFMSIIPLGLWFAHREHVSLRRLSQESVAEEEKVLGQPPSS